ncbi:MAG: hypothetical protein LBV15_03830, partial [Planctomycetota bacterium]|nr:hypothetical protein [Planctomycetota bacterium]
MTTEREAPDVHAAKLMSVGSRSESLAAALAAGDLLILSARGSSLAKDLAGAKERLGRPLLLVTPDPEVAEDIHNDIIF